jgi:hypothetical protein
MKTVPTYKASIVTGRYWNIVFKITDSKITDLSDFEFKAQFKQCLDCKILATADISVDLPLTVKIELSKQKTKLLPPGTVIGEVSYKKAAGDPVTLFFIEAEILKPINDYAN